MEAASAACFRFMGENGIRMLLYCSVIPESVSHPEEEFC